jgi:Family of unknown function (DUF5716)
VFGVLNSNIFTLFAGANRRLYEEVLVKAYATWFRADLLFPRQSEVVALIYDLLGEAPELWREDEAPVSLDQVLGRRGRRLRRRGLAAADEAATTEAMGRARHIYGRLLETGWLEESRYGLRVTVDMPSGAMRLLEFLCLLREGVSEELGGLVMQVKTAVEAVRTNARENALGLHKAARDAAAFGRYLRSVLASLRDIDRLVLASENIDERLQHYFEGFVGRVLLKDYAAITTTSHPYRFRHRIFDALQGLESSIVDLQILADAYLEARLAPDATAAKDLVYDDLTKVRHVFDRIEEAFRRIQQHRSRLEGRLRNTVRYAGRQTGVFLQRSEALILKLDRSLARGAELPLSGALESFRPPASPLLLARPRGVRVPIVSGALALPVDDPVWALRRQLEHAYLDRLTVDPVRVLRFLERRVPPHGESLASNLWLESVDDFLAFEALRRAVPQVVAGAAPDALARRLTRHFAFVPTPDETVDNEWLRCADFRVRRLSDHVTLEAARAS